MEASFAAGVDAFIPKPFNLKSFNETYLNLVDDALACGDDCSRVV